MNSPRIALLLAAGLVTALTGGCAPLGLQLGIAGEAPAPRASERPRPDPAGIRLAEAAERAEAALTALAMMRAAASPPPVPDVPVAVPTALQRRVTVDWVGPVETLAEALAGRAGYRFAMGGAAPARPVMVSVRVRDVPLIEALRDTGLQAGNAATLAVDAGRRTVRLDWTGEPPGPGELPGAGELPGSGARRDGAAGSGGS